MSTPDPSPSEHRPSPEAEKAFGVFLLSQHGQGKTSFEDFVRRHPELERELRELHERWTSPSQTGGRSRSFARRLRARHGESVDPAISLGDEGGESGRSPSSTVLARLMAKGTTTERYELHGEIARGGMGAILRVWD